MNAPQPLKLTSHVSRDFLQNAAYFNTVGKIVWEYVSNSLDAMPDDRAAVVSVQITTNYITVSDNGPGMSREELANFFTMHAENVHRNRGKRVRGRFGTGKCAAFGLADMLTMETVQNGLLNKVQLSRQALDSARTGQPVPILELEVDSPTDGASGTRVDITGLQKTRLNVNKAIEYVERHLARYRRHAEVTINGHVCAFSEPPSVSQYQIPAPSDVARELGNLTLAIKVSPTPLEKDLQGIEILSYGIWHETTLAGLEGRERADYIFGEIDVPLLEDGDWAIPPFDNTRNNTLNRANEAVTFLLAWISEELERVRSELVREQKHRRESEQARKLAEEASRIARILNDDFAELEMALDRARRVAGGQGIASTDEIEDASGEPTPGEGDIPTSWQEAGSEHGQGSKSDEGAPGDQPRPGPSLIPGSDHGTRRSTSTGNRKRRRAVFSIEYENATEGNSRSRYESETKTIYINLDHPQIDGAFRAGGSRTDSRYFREMSYEAAAVEYALAIPYERVSHDPYYAATDALYDVGDRIDRVSRRFAAVII